MKLDRANHEHALYFRGSRFGKPATIRITAVFLTESEAHAHMGTHPSDGVIAVIGPIILMADVNDPGVGRHPKGK